jgi:hypothetical protein
MKPECWFQVAAEQLDPVEMLLAVGTEEVVGHHTVPGMASPGLFTWWNLC